MLYVTCGLLKQAGAEAVVIKSVEQLEEIDGFILPGGESTTMRKLIDKYDFMEPSSRVCESGKPIFGTCAGLILLAKRMVGYDEPHIGAMDITVERNSFGRQRESFEADFDYYRCGRRFSSGIYSSAAYC